MSSRPLALVLGAFLMLVPTMGRADPGAQPCIHDALGDAFAAGYVTHSVRSAALEAGGTRQFAITMQGGSEYAIRSCGDAGELELMLYDGNGHVVARSRADKGPATVVYSPSSTRRYHVVAYARDGGGPVARNVAVAVTYR